jgi:hypothetical protein
MGAGREGNPGIRLTLLNFCNTRNSYLSKEEYPLNTNNKILSDSYVFLGLSVAFAFSGFRGSTSM